MNVITKTTWNDIKYKEDELLETEKSFYILDEVAKGTTDGIESVGCGYGLSSMRTWYSNAAADAWIKFITDLAIKYGFSVTVTKV